MTLEPAAKEDIQDACDTILSVASYLKESLDAGRPIYESAWLDPLMIVHGELLELLETEQAE